MTGLRTPKGTPPADVAATLRRSIEASARGYRRVRVRKLAELFGFGNWTTDRKDLVTRLLAEQGIRVAPPLDEGGRRDHWLNLSMPTVAPAGDPVHPDEGPPGAFFDGLEAAQLASEREVEMHFASPLFRALGYTEDQEAAGFAFDMWEGVHHRQAYADLVYFATAARELAPAGAPLVLVEAKDPSKLPDAGVGQARSYSFWVKPVYYVVTNGECLTAYAYQGGTIPDPPVLSVTREQLRARFDEVYGLLSPAAVLTVRQERDRVAGAEVRQA